MIDTTAFVHSHALVDSRCTIGARTRVWAFTHILNGAQIGDDCNICDHVFVENDVVVGNRVTIKCGVYLWDKVRIEDDVFIGPAVVFTNDMRPRSKVYHGNFLGITLRQGCSIGANATLLPGVEIGKFALIAAGAVVTKNVRDYGLVKGNPAKHVGWVCRCARKLEFEGESAKCDCGESYEIATGDGGLQVLHK